MMPWIQAESGQEHGFPLCKHPPAAKRHRATQQTGPQPMAGGAERAGVSLLRALLSESWGSGPPFSDWR